MRRQALDFIAAAGPWAITEEGFAKVRAIAERENLHPEEFAKLEAVLTRANPPLPDATYATFRDGVAIVPISGPLFPKANLMTEFSGATSVQCAIQDMYRADANPDVKGIVLDFHTPGGVAKGITEASGVIATLKKPCVAYVSGLCCSAGFPLAAAANGGIVCAPDAILGSLGVVMSLPAKTGKEPVEIVSSQSPDKRPDHGTPEGRATLQKLVDDLAAVFLGNAAKLRNTTPEKLMEARGGVLVGQDAIDFKLADRLGSLESVIAELAGQPAPRKTYSLPGGKPPMNAAELKAQHPETYAAVFEAGRKAGIDEGKTAGATAERERIQAVEAAWMPGHEKLIADLKFDGKTTGGEAALAVIQAEKEGNAQHLEAWRQEGQAAHVPPAKRPGDPEPPPKAEGKDDGGQGGGATATIPDSYAVFQEQRRKALNAQ